MTSFTIPVPSMTCSSCTGPISNTLSKFKQLKNLEVSLDNGGFVKFTIEIGATLCLQDVINELEDLGREIDVNKILNHDEIDPENLKDNNQSTLNEQQYLYRSLACATVGLPLMIFSILGISLPIYAMVIVGALSFITMLYAGQDIFKHGIKQTLKTGSFSMDSLFTISTLTAFGVSITAFFIPGLAFEFETALLIFSSRHLGKYLETKMKQKVTKELNFSSKLPQTALQILKNEVTGIETFKAIDINSLKIGDVILLNANDYIPADGVLSSERTTLYTTLISGNLIAETAHKNALLYAGTQVAEGQLRMQVTKPLAESLLMKCEQASEKAKNKKTTIETLTEKVIQYFIPSVLIISALTAAISLPIYGASVALHSAIAILVGACPCTLGFIAPLTMRVGLDRSAKHGALVQNPQAIEIAKDIKNIVFDLNGTLTQGVPQVSHAVIYNNLNEQEIMNAVFQLESSVEKPHNIGLALKNYAKQKLKKPKPLSKIFTDLKQDSLPGIKAKIDANFYLLGNDSLMEANKIKVPENSQRIFLAKNNQLIAHFDITDPLHKDAKFTVSQLQKQGLNVILCTGASVTTAQFYAKQLGIKKIKAACHGGIAKQEFIKTLNGKVAMIGDAINDSVALQEADIGIAVANADEYSRAASDIIINSQGPLAILNFFKNSQDTMSIIKQNLAMSLLYNLAVMAFTTTLAISIGPVAPGVMAFLMALQSIIVLANTYRLKQQPLNIATEKNINTNCQTNIEINDHHFKNILRPRNQKQQSYQDNKTISQSMENLTEEEFQPTIPLI